MKQRKSSSFNFLKWGFVRGMILLWMVTSKSSQNSEMTIFRSCDITSVPTAQMATLTKCVFNRGNASYDVPVRLYGVRWTLKYIFHDVNISKRFLTCYLMTLIHASSFSSLMKIENYLKLSKNSLFDWYLVKITSKSYLRIIAQSSKRFLKKKMGRWSRGLNFG